MTADVPASEPHMLYHMPMARKEVLVQLDDELVRRLDALAAKAGISRSELLRRGAIAVLEASEFAEADQALIDAYRRQPKTRRSSSLLSAWLRRPRPSTRPPRAPLGRPGSAGG